MYLYSIILGQNGKSLALHGNFGKKLRPLASGQKKLIVRICLTTYTSVQSML